MQHYWQNVKQKIIIFYSQPQIELDKKEKILYLREESSNLLLYFLVLAFPGYEIRKDNLPFK